MIFLTAEQISAIDQLAHDNLTVNEPFLITYAGKVGTGEAPIDTAKGDRVNFTVPGFKTFSIDPSGVTSFATDKGAR